MIGPDSIRSVMEQHLDEGLEAVCKRLSFDDKVVYAHLAERYGPVAPIITGYLAIGIDLGVALERSRVAESEPVNDEFLESLPEAHL